MRRAVDIPDGLDVDELMLRAIDATRSTYPHPNPRVGAFIVDKDHVVLAMGVHQGPGLPHAEATALASIRDRASLKGATAIVTLEPCSHHGRTPPCADALIASGVTHVVIGALDPDPRVSGAGVDRLEQAGIEVRVGVEEAAVIEADPAYFHHRRTGRPFVTLKVASTLDGQVAAEDGTSQWITGEEARRDVHRLRSEHDAIAVGSGTVIADDPMLTVRLPDYEGPQPRPVIVCGTRPIPGTSRVLSRDPMMIGDGTGPVDIGTMVKDLGADGIVALMVEGGPTLAGSFLRAGMVDRIVWYFGAKIGASSGLGAVSGAFGTLGDATDVQITGVRRLGNGVRVTATIPTDGGGT